MLNRRYLAAKLLLLIVLLPEESVLAGDGFDLEQGAGEGLLRVVVLSRPVRAHLTVEHPALVLFLLWLFVAIVQALNVLLEVLLAPESRHG